MQEFSSKRQLKNKELRLSQILFIAHSVICAFSMAAYVYLVAHSFVTGPFNQWLYFLPVLWGLGLGLNYITLPKLGQSNRVAKLCMRIHYTAFLITTSIFAVLIPQTFGNNTSHYPTLYLFLIAWFIGVVLHYVSLSNVAKNNTISSLKKAEVSKEQADSIWPPFS